MNLIPFAANCWFCNKWNRVSYQDRNKFYCSRCNQYNGFTKDGDYNKEMGHLHEKQLTEYFTTRKTLSTAKDVLCSLCNHNQLLKIQQLANYTPMCEKNYDIEIEHFRSQIEATYELCNECDKRLKQVLDNQNAWLKLQHDGIRHDRNKSYKQGFLKFLNVLVSLVTAIMSIIIILCILSNNKNWTGETYANRIIKTITFDPTICKICQKIDETIKIVPTQTLFDISHISNGGLLFAGIMIEIFYLIVTLDLSNCRHRILFWTVTLTIALQSKIHLPFSSLIFITSLLILSALYNLYKRVLFIIRNKGNPKFTNTTNEKESTIRNLSHNQHAKSMDSKKENILRQCNFKECTTQRSVVPQLNKKLFSTSKLHHSSEKEVISECNQQIELSNVRKLNNQLEQLQLDDSREIVAVKRQNTFDVRLWTSRTSLKDNVMRNTSSRLSNCSQESGFESQCGNNEDFGLSSEAQQLERSTTASSLNLRYDMTIRPEVSNNYYCHYQYSIAYPHYYAPHCGTVVRRRENDVNNVAFSAFRRYSSLNTTVCGRAGPARGGGLLQYRTE